MRSGGVRGVCGMKSGWEWELWGMAWNGGTWHGNGWDVPF